MPTASTAELVQIISHPVCNPSLIFQFCGRKFSHSGLCRKGISLAVVSRQAEKGFVISGANVLYFQSVEALPAFLGHLTERVVFGQCMMRGPSATQLMTLSALESLGPFHLRASWWAQMPKERSNLLPALELSLLTFTPKLKSSRDNSGGRVRRWALCQVLRPNCKRGGSSPSLVQIPSPFKPHGPWW